MDDTRSSNRSYRRHRTHPSDHHRHREDSNISRSSSQHTPNDNVEYGGICPKCGIAFDELGIHEPICPFAPIVGNPDAFSDRDERERPQYGKEMHPANRNFSRRNPMTSSSSNPQQVPLDTSEEGETVSSNVSYPVTSSYGSQAPESPPFAVSNARAWDQTWGFQQRRDHQRPEARFSEASSSSSGLPVPQLSERYLQRLDGHGTSRPAEYRAEGLRAPQAAQNQPTQYPRDRPLSLTSDSNASTVGSVSYSYITPSPLAPRSTEYISPPRPAPPARQDLRGREQNRPEHHSSMRSSPRLSEFRSRNDEGYRETERSRQRPPPSSATRTQRQDLRDERPTSYAFRHVEARPSRRAGHGYAGESEEYVIRDGYTSAPRTPNAPSRRGTSHQTGGPVFPGDRSQFSRSYLREMGRLQFGETSTYDNRADEARYDEEDDSDDHQFSPEYLREMSRIRNWSSRR